MVKGFIDFRDGRIPFVIENYRMELFTDDNLLKDFAKEFNRRSNYVLSGQYFGMGGFQPNGITVLVDYSMGDTCYLLCYLLEGIGSEGYFDTIRFQSNSLDGIFKYRYNYLDIVRGGTNLAIAPKEVYKVPFHLEDNEYELIFRIGHNERLGLLDDLEKKGEVIVPLSSGNIQEYYTLTRVLQRFAAFMVSQFDAPFQKITLYRNELVEGWFYCKLVSENAVSSGFDVLFYEFDVMKYVPKILNNIALDSGSKITKSVPLGHLAHASFPFTPQRFIEQVTAFEYLFEKLNPENAKDRNFPLKKELKYMFDSFSKILSNSKKSSEDVSQDIKEVRRSITHGYAYYYDFGIDSDLQYMIIQLDKLIKAMSLKWIGFSLDDIDEYIRY